jgi:hypothetical protein
VCFALRRAADLLHRQMPPALSPDSLKTLQEPDMAFRPRYTPKPNPTPAQVAASIALQAPTAGANAPERPQEARSGVPGPQGAATLPACHPESATGPDSGSDGPDGSGAA